MSRRRGLRSQPGTWVWGTRAMAQRGGLLARAPGDWRWQSRIPGAHTTLPDGGVSMTCGQPRAALCRSRDCRVAAPLAPDSEAVVRRGGVQRTGLQKGGRPMGSAGNLLAGCHAKFRVGRRVQRALQRMHSFLGLLHPRRRQRPSPRRAVRSRQTTPSCEAQGRTMDDRRGQGPARPGQARRIINRQREHWACGLRLATLLQHPGPPCSVLINGGGPAYNIASRGPATGAVSHEP